MQEHTQSLSNHQTLQHTRAAFLWTRICSIPIWALVTILPMILYKDLHITPLQITMIIALKPLSALFAPYWSVSIYQRQDRLISNLAWANSLRYLPFLFFPWIDSAWLMIIGFSVFMMLTRGAIPAWMEIFKRNIPNQDRERIFAYGTALDYLGSAIVPIGLGILLDGYADSWRWIFFIGALLGLGSTLFLSRMPAPTSASEKLPLSDIALPTLVDQLIKPWVQSWKLIKVRPDFTYFLSGFMLGGSGLMIMQPALPMFFSDVLNLSYTEIMTALVACKGIGLAATSPLWVKYFRKVDIFSFTGSVTLVATLFPFLLWGAQYQMSLLYLAYIIYGMMQAGSELSWHLSGPVFSKESDSSLFSRTNVLTVGLRGSVIPFIGSLLYSWTNSTTVMLFGALLCLMAAYRLLSYERVTITTHPPTPSV